MGKVCRNKAGMITEPGHLLHNYQTSVKFTLPSYKPAVSLFHYTEGLREHHSPSTLAVTSMIHSIGTTGVSNTSAIPPSNLIKLNSNIIKSSSINGIIILKIIDSTIQTYAISKCMA